jgi:hypothetical protein
MILIALIAVFAGVYRVAPGVVIVLLVCPALAWAITGLSARRRRRDEPMCGMERAVWTIVLTVLIPIGATVMFLFMILVMILFCIIIQIDIT